MDIEDRLEVKVIQAKGLVPPRGAGGYCNPSVIVSCDVEVIQTKTMSRTNSPEWKNAEPMAFFHVSESRANHLVCSVKHKDLVTSRSIPLGNVTIPLATSLLSPGIPADEWYAISRLPDHPMLAQLTWMTSTSAFVGTRYSRWATPARRAANSECCASS